MHPNEAFLTKFKTKEAGQELVRNMTNEVLALKSSPHFEAFAEQLQRLNILPELQDNTARVIGEINGTPIYDS
jgi:hypothetical protein